MPVKFSAPVQFLVLLFASYVNQGQQRVIEYLQTENRVLRERLGPARLRFTDAERRQLAENGQPVGRKSLARVATVASPETILRWYRRLVAAKYDGSARRGTGRPSAHEAAKAQLLTMARENRPSTQSKAGRRGPTAMTANELRRLLFAREIIVVDLVEAALLTGREGETFPAVVIDDGLVQLAAPAVRGRLEGGGAETGSAITVRLVRAVVRADVAARTVEFSVA